jgi:aminobenzoyl-glutamate utilization protein B
MSIGHKGMTFAAKTLAATMVDLFEQPEKRAEIRREFEENTKGGGLRGVYPERAAARSGGVIASPTYRSLVAT